MAHTKQPKPEPEPEPQPQLELRQQPLSRSAQRYVNSLWRSLDQIDQESPVAVATIVAQACSRDNKPTVDSRRSIEKSDKAAADGKLRAVAVVQREQQAKFNQRSQPEQQCGERERTPDTASSSRASRKHSTDAVRHMMQLQEIAGQLVAAEAAASKAESAMWELRPRTPRNSDCVELQFEPEADQGAMSDGSDVGETDDEVQEDWSPHRASVRVASAASAAVAAAAVEEVARLRAELADRDRQIAEFLRTQTANAT